MRYLLSILLVFYLGVSWGQSLNPKYKTLLDSFPEKIFDFAIKKTNETKSFCEKENIKIKYQSDSYLFVRAPLAWMHEQSTKGNIPHYQFDVNKASPLADSVRSTRNIDPVHSGLGGLPNGYTGKDVIIGFIDYGLELDHPDFQDVNGKTRVLRLWDQEAVTSYGYYGYGTLWDSTEINAGSCTYNPTSDHGSTVAGQGAGNGLADGTNKGVAPDANIVFINLDLSSGYQARIADACDYIFKFADSLGLPAVVNIGVGSPMGGGHDGNDPYSEYVESLLNAKSGRIAVASAGNYGGYGNYHLRGNVSPDTSFTWFNTADFSAFGLKHGVYFEMYADTNDAHFDFAIGMDKPAPNYGFRGRTNFKNTYNNLGVYEYDTIWSGTNQLAIIQTYQDVIDSAYYMETYVVFIDSSSYKVRFMTKGSGAYDLWSSDHPDVGFNKIEEAIPTPAIIPEIINYQLPDSLNVLAAYYMNSEKIITVGNFNNRQGYTDRNGLFYDNSIYPTGEIYYTSSRGPNRLQNMKPDVSANGNLSFGAARISYLSNPANFDKIIQTGWHIRNGGTSMAAPVISGMAALYLERCPTATYQDFKRDLIEASEKDSYTGPLANYSYGHGKPNALKLLQDKNSYTIDGDTLICNLPTVLSSSSHLVYDSIVWSDGSNTYNSSFLNVSSPAQYSAQIYYGGGCKALTDTVTVTSIIPNIPTLESISQPTCISPFGTIEIVNQPNVLYSLGVGSASNSPVFNGLNPGNYFLYAKSSYDTTCFTTSLNQETINSIPPLSIDPITPLQFCDSVQLPLINGGTLTGNEAYYTSSNRNGIKYLAGDFILQSVDTLFFSDSLGGCFIEDTLLLNGDITANPSFYYDAICEGDSISPILSGDLGGVFSSLTPLINSESLNSNSGKFVSSDSMNYYIQYKVGAVCPDSLIDTLVVKALPNQIVVTPIDTTYNINDLVVPFQSNKSNSNSIVYWYSDSLKTDLISVGDDYTPQSTDTVLYVFESLDGCESIYRLVRVNFKTDALSLSTAITPDGDMQNDTWLIPNIDSDFPQNEVFIYNRWGELVFQSEKGSYEISPWDGTFGGEELSVGSYYYIIRYNKSSIKDQTGIISIIK